MGQAISRVLRILDKGLFDSFAALRDNRLVMRKPFSFGAGELRMRNEAVNGNTVPYRPTAQHSLTVVSFHSITVTAMWTRNDVTITSTCLNGRSFS